MCQKHVWGKLRTKWCVRDNTHDTKSAGLLTVDFRNRGRIGYIFISSTQQCCRNVTGVDTFWFQIGPFSRKAKHSTAAQPTKTYATGILKFIKSYRYYFLCSQSHIITFWIWPGCTAASTHARAARKQANHDCWTQPSNSQEPILGKLNSMNICLRCTNGIMSKRPLERLYLLWG